MKTLIEAIVLVVLVMFVFLQSWRATLIPAIAMPVVLLGTFAVLYVAGFTINTLTLFGLVLAIGLLVDDAIVVVENVERLMDENPGHDARATRPSSRWSEIQVALVAIALVLSAVFLPMAFFGGSTGVIYRQFSITIVSAMVLSVLVALILSPALTVDPAAAEAATARSEPSWLDRRCPAIAAAVRRAQAWFNTQLRPASSSATAASVVKVIDRKWLFLAIYAGIVAVLVVHVLPPADRLPADRGPGRGQRPVPPAAGRDPGAHARSAARRSSTISPSTRRRTSRPCSPSPAAAAAAARRPEHRPGLHQSRAVGRAHGQGEHRRRDRPARARARSAACATRRSSRSCPAPIRGLGQSSGFTMELQNTRRHEPRASSSPPATSCSQQANADPQARRRSA